MFCSTTMRSAIWLTAAVLISSVSSAVAQRREPAAEPPEKIELPAYPRVNLAPSYEVDPAWPKKPDDTASAH